jgi:hypothetical protein
VFSVLKIFILSQTSLQLRHCLLKLSQTIKED